MGDKVVRDSLIEALTNYRLPGRAGSIQERGDLRALVAEMGDNYDLYHDALADDLDALGEPPDPRDYIDDYVEYARLNNLWIDIVKAEVALRAYAHMREFGVAEPVESRHARPVLDERHRLVSRSSKHDLKRARRKGRQSAADWVPPETPRWLTREK